jgi:hypothetical protein
MEKEVKLFFFTDDMILYVKDSKNSTKSLLDMMINTFDSVAGYKINIQKSVLFYIPIMKSQRKNSGKQFHSQYSQKKKKSTHELNQGGERPLQ